jgi:hypothetical protein
MFFAFDGSYFDPRLYYDAFTAMGSITAMIMAIIRRSINLIRRFYSKMTIPIPIVMLPIIIGVFTGGKISGIVSMVSVRKRWHNFFAYWWRCINYI